MVREVLYNWLHIPFSCEKLSSPVACWKISTADNELFMLETLFGIIDARHDRPPATLVCFLIWIFARFLVWLHRLLINKCIQTNNMHLLFYFHCFWEHENIFLRSCQSNEKRGFHLRGKVLLCFFVKKSVISRKISRHTRLGSMRAW